MPGSRRYAVVAQHTVENDMSGVRVYARVLCIFELTPDSYTGDFHRFEDAFAARVAAFNGEAEQIGEGAPARMRLETRQIATKHAVPGYV